MTQNDRSEIRLYPQSFKGGKALKKAGKNPDA